MNMLKQSLLALAITAMPVCALAEDKVSSVATELGADGDTIPVQVLQPGQGELARTLKMALNKTTILEFDEDVDDILVANPGIADVLARSKRRIAVMGRGKGESGIIFMGKDGRELLSLDVVVAGQGVTELQALIERFVPQSNIKADFVNGAIVLSGSTHSLADADLAIQLSRQYVTDGRPVINMVSISGKDQVLLKVRIVEMQRSVVKQLGVNLSGAVNVGELTSTAADAINRTVSVATANSFGLSGGPLGGLSAAAGYQNYVGDNLQSSIGGALDMLERVGLVRTLAEPNLTALSGENAKFLAGGEFPVPSGSDDNGNISLSFKPFGVGLGFTPVVLSAGRISMRISTEVSEITNQGGFQAGGQVVVDGNGNTYTTPAIVVPAVKVRRADTTVELPSGGSLVVAGLIQEQTRQAMDAIPGAGDIPVLGALFRSREFINDETELVIIVTPYLVDPTDPNRLREPDDGYVTPRDGKTILFGKLNEVYGVEGNSAGAGEMHSGAGFIID